MATQATIHINGRFPAFVGDQESGYSLDCKKCGQILIKHVYDRQIVGLFIECSSCKTITPTQQRGAGEAIPTRRVQILNGDYNFSGAVDVKSKPQAIVSENALSDYHREVGYKYISSTSSEELDETFLSGLADKAIDLLGEAVYKRHLSTIKQSSTSKTPKANHHRLVELTQYALESVEKLGKAAGKEVVISGDLIAELWAIVTLFGRWQQHPAWEELKKSLANSNDVQHNLIQLATASALADQDNGVGIIFGVSSGRIPDLYIRLTYEERLEAEVKTPVALHGPVNGLSVDEAVKIIERQLNKGASAKTGQINPSASGLFVLGGFHIERELMPTLEDAARNILERQKDRKGHLMAMVICILSYEYSTILDQSGQIITKSFRPVFVIKTIEHPGYKGQLKLSS
jgi:hypothetical protein